MPTVTRELSVTYAGLTIGGTSDTHLLFDRHEVTGSYGTIGFKGLVLVRADTAANFATYCAQLETAFSTPNGALAITISGNSIKSFGHSGSTGFLGRPSYRKMGGKEDTARSRLYEVTVAAQRPADLSGKNGLRVASISVATKFFGARSYRVSGTYTSISSTSARAQYAASVGTFLSAIETDLTGTWTRMDAEVEYDDENKVANFTQDAYETGLRDGSYTISTTVTGLRSYRVVGAYTSVGATGAQATYAAAIGTLLTAFETGLTGTWLRGANSTTRDQSDKLLRFEYMAIETGLRDAVYEVATATTGERTYRVTGQYEKVSSTGAEATYTAAIAAVLTTFESGLTGTWEREESLYQRNQNDTIVTFEWKGRELIYNQSAGVLNNASIKEPRIRIERLSDAPGDSSTAVVRPIRLIAYFDAGVDKAQTQDLKTLWDGTILPYLVDRSKAASDSSSCALLQARPNFDYTANRITAVILVESYAGAILRMEIETEDNDTTGVVLAPLWSAVPYENDEGQVQPTRTRMVTTIAERLSAEAGAGGVGGGGVGGSGSSPSAPVGSTSATVSEGYVLVYANAKYKTVTRGLAGYQTPVHIETMTEFYQYRKRRATAGPNVKTEAR